MTMIRNTIPMRYFSNVAKSMELYEVVPDVIDVAPQEICEVNFPSGVKANLGNVLTPSQVKDTPIVKWMATNGVFYTLLVTDPDAPSRKRPKLREWLYWLVGNIPGLEVSKGDTLSEYVGAGPPKTTSLHRCVYLIYKQEDKLSFDEPRLTNVSADKRTGFSVRKFAAKYKLGSPIAGNFYLAEWDNHVPVLYKQLGLKHPR